MLGVAAFCGTAVGQDQFVFYFGSGVADAGKSNAMTPGANGSFWIVGNDAEQRIRHLTPNGSGWTGTDNVIASELNLFHRTDDLAGGAANDGGGWGQQFGGAANGVSLNPAPLTIEVPTGSGGTTTVVYPAGSLAFVIDNVDVITEPSGLQRPDLTKRLYRYDQRIVTNSTAGLPAHQQFPDYDTAEEFTGSPPIGSFGTADWNDVFQPVVSRQDVINAGGVTAPDQIGRRQFAWSGDGQAIYAVDSSDDLGGIYRIDPTRWANDPGGVDRVWVDGVSGGPNLREIATEPAVVPTATRNFAPGLFGTGDQIVVEGSFQSGNTGGLNVFFDDRSTNQLAAPQPIFSEQDFRRFADYYSNSTNANFSGVPRYQAVAADDEGNLYIYENKSDLLFRYDTEGRFVKIASEPEKDLFQADNGVPAGDDQFFKLFVRESNEPGFAVTEVVYLEGQFEAPAGILAYKPGDFDRDNDVDATDLSLFSAALGPRNTAAADTDYRFDLNGNRPAVFAFNEDGTPELTDDGVQRIRHPSDGGAVVDWRDVKVLQQFVDIPTGDADFDLDLDLDDIDVVAANYYTVDSGVDNTWRDGDFGSIDPDYFFEVADANIVNEVDINLLADTWLNELGQAAPDEATLSARYSGQFLTDVIAAFAGDPGGLAGDYDGDGDVDVADYNVWTSAFGQAGSGLAADGNGDGAVGAADYTVWRDNLTGDYNGDGQIDAADYTVWRDQDGQTGAGLAADGNADGSVDATDYGLWAQAFGFGAIASTAVAAPEPSSAAVTLVGLLALGVARGRRIDS